MRVHANILDTILDTPNNGNGGGGGSKIASGEWGDLFLDTPTRDFQHGGSAGSKQAAASGALMEAVTDIEGRGKAKTADLVKDRDLTDSNACDWVKRLLNDGEKPADIDAKLEKLADLQGFDKSIASEYLKDHAGVMGLAYIEPNAYMNDCVSTNDRIQTKLGGTRAVSVKQVAACPGCRYFDKTAGAAGNAKHCNLYHLPIISSKAELVQVIASLTPGAINKKAALVQIANASGVIAAPVAKSSSFGRTEAKGAILGLTPKRTLKKTAASFNDIDVLNLHNEGRNIKDIFAKGVEMVGAGPAEKAIKTFIAKLKTGKTKIALSQIDCTLLGGKLSSSNAIHGAKKCASCTYRNGMHCGLTGGTLLDFPGMATAKVNHRIAAGALLDGTSLVNEFDMAKRHDLGDIDMLEDVAGGFELGDFGHMDL